MTLHQKDRLHNDQFTLKYLEHFLAVIYFSYCQSFVTKSYTIVYFKSYQIFNTFILSLFSYRQLNTDVESEYPTLFRIFSW